MRPQIIANFRRRQTARTPEMGSEDSIALLNTLIECCKDSEYDFRGSAEHVDSPNLRPLFIGRA